MGGIHSKYSKGKVREREKWYREIDLKMKHITVDENLTWY